jgi:hypothetical protein
MFWCGDTQAEASSLDIHGGKRFAVFHPTQVAFVGWTTRSLSTMVSGKVPLKDEPPCPATAALACQARLTSLP